MVEKVQEMIQFFQQNSDMQALWKNVLIFMLILLFAIIANVVAKKFLLRGVEKFAKASRITWDDILMENHVFRRFSHFIPALIIYGFAPVVFALFPAVILVIQKLAVIYMIFISIFVIDAILNSVVAIYKTFSSRSHKVPIRSFVQMLKIVVYFFGGVIILATILNKSPMYFIGGMGALAAVLMLVFKDPILGLVAGVQLASNKMVHLGDWVEMPTHGADGAVIDISLTTIKVQNWDKTITTVPTYSMVSESFINWRGMEESAGRRIKRSFRIDASSVKFCTEEMLEKFKKYECIKHKLPSKIEEISAHNRESKQDISLPVNGRRLTNIGVFRMYLESYIEDHPKIEKSLTHMVRQLESTEFGIPIQVYAFANDKSWIAYEGIQADIFDHIFAVVKEFELKIYQRPKD